MRRSGRNGRGHVDPGGELARERANELDLRVRKDFADRLNGSVAKSDTTASRAGSFGRFPSLGSNAKEGVNELPLAYHVALRQPSDLPFADHMHCLVTLDRPPCPFRRPEPEARRNALLDEPVVLLNHVV